MKTSQIKLISLFVLLVIFQFSVDAQYRPKQLKKEVLREQQGPQNKGVKGKPNSTAQTKSFAEPVNPLTTPNAKLVYLESCQSLTFDQMLLPGIQVLKGEVRFRHDNILMYCDSAYFKESQNSLDAFGHVKIVQGDTLFVYGDILYYDGNTKLARLRKNVRMENRKTILTTDSLNYDRAAALAYYFTGGKIKDQLNQLTSVWGQYAPPTNQAFFKNKVELINKDFVLHSDTLKYNTKSHIADILSKSHIKYNKETDIHTSKGWYNTETDKMMLLNRSLVLHNDGKQLTGDTIFYDKKLNYGESFHHVELKDTVQKSTLMGNYVNYYQKDKKGLATDSAVMVDWSTKDTFYVHADTLKTWKDSVYDVVHGYTNVRFFRNDVQGLCDSLLYSARDSVMNMNGAPIVWSDNNQLSGQLIRVFTKNKKVEHVQIKGSAIAMQMEDSIHFNQSGGKEIIALMDSGQIKKVLVNGNAETIYYPKDDKDSTLIGMNRTKSSFVASYFKKKKIQKVVLTTISNGSFYPLSKLSGNDMKLKNFSWSEIDRPMEWKDILKKTSIRKPSVENESSKVDKNEIGKENNRTVR